MKRIIGVITGVISFICALGWLCFTVYMVREKKDDLLVYGTLFCFVLSTIVYVILTKFGITNSKEIDKIMSENQVLKLQIEQKELKKKLEE